MKTVSTSLQIFQQRQQNQQTTSYNRKVTQTNMVYIVGLPLFFADKQILCSEPYCGQYGVISKINIKKALGYRSQCYNAYITYESEESASLAVMALRQFSYNEYNISASYGTTKYCSSFLRYGKCQKNDCMFHHQIQPQKEIHQQDNKKVFNKQQELAKNFIYKNNSNINFSSPLEKYIFPSKSSVYQFLIDEGVVLKIDQSKNKRFSEAQTECSYSMTQKQQQLQNDLILLKKMKHAVHRQKSFFSFVMNKDIKQYEYVNKFLQDYIDSSVSDF